MLPLEPTDDLANPAFKDAASCTKWLSQLQLTNLNLAQNTLRKQLDELNRCPFARTDRLQILEALRETVALVQSDFAKKLTGKKLPLTDDEFALLIALSSLCRACSPAICAACKRWRRATSISPMTAHCCASAACCMAACKSRISCSRVASPAEKAGSNCMPSMHMSRRWACRRRRCAMSATSRAWPSVAARCMPKRCSCTAPVCWD